MSATEPGRPAARRAGFTLIELLLASALLVVLLSAAAGLLGGAAGAERSGREAAGRDGAARLALELLRAELSLAGSDPDETGTWGERQAVEIDAADPGFGDRVVVRYVDAVAGPIEASWEAARDGGGRANLYRSEPGATRQPAVAGVRHLRVVTLEPLVRLELRLEAGETRRLAVPLPARQGAL